MEQLKLLKESYFNLIESVLKKQLEHLTKEEISTRCKVTTSAHKGTRYYIDDKLILVIPYNNIVCENNKIYFKVLVPKEYEDE